MKIQKLLVKTIGDAMYFEQFVLLIYIRVFDLSQEVVGANESKFHCDKCRNLLIALQEIIYVLAFSTGVQGRLNQNCWCKVPNGNWQYIVFGRFPMNLLELLSSVCKYTRKYGISKWEMCKVLFPSIRTNFPLFLVVVWNESTPIVIDRKPPKRKSLWGRITFLPFFSSSDIYSAH